MGLIGAAVLAVISGCAYMYLPKFGRLPEKDRLSRIEHSPHYRDGEFRNLDPIPETIEKSGMIRTGIRFLFRKKERTKPQVPVVSIKTDLSGLDKNTDAVVWMGHSSLFIQLAGKRFLVDPVFSSNAAPVPGANTAFPGTLIYSAADIPDIDYLLISHDHWDHLDFPTVSALRDKVGKIICPLGVGAHFERWDYPLDRIVEADWYDAVQLDDGLSVHVLPARHFSGRGLTRNKTLWAAFALVSPQQKIYFSGDSGYGSHFHEAGKRFGGFDLVILDCGQYNEGWRFVHMMPEEAVDAAEALQAKAFLPAHIGKFSIAFHSWDDPFVRVTTASENKAFRLLTPRLGEPVMLDDTEQKFERWWETMILKESKLR